MVTMTKRPPETRPYRALGRRIAAARAARKLTQRQLAELIDVSSSYPNQIEQGRNRPDTDVLAAIARVLELDYDELAVLAGYQRRQAPDVRVEGSSETAALLRQYAEYPPEFLRMLLDVGRRMWLWPGRSVSDPEGPVRRIAEDGTERDTEQPPQ